MDERTKIPLTWVLVGYVPTTGFVITCALWAFSIDARLARLEQKAGIHNPISQQTPSLLIPYAIAQPASYPVKGFP